jgi:hypothetical protein
MFSLSLSIKINNMTQEFIPCEQALALKELGFDEPCLFWYNLSDNKKLATNAQFDSYNPTTYTNTSIPKKSSYNEELKSITAPLYQQAFRWFREKHNIQGYIYSSTVRGNVEKTKQFTGYIWNINGIDIPFLSTDARDELHDTYEEAELACLNKLIEIVKEK